MNKKDKEDAEALKGTSVYLNALARSIDAMLNGGNTPPEHKKYGFALLVYPTGQIDQSHINYIGNGNRADMLAALKELTARWEAPAPAKPEMHQ